VNGLDGKGPRVGQKIGVLGGTFDPIHIGHLVSARDVQQTLSLDGIQFVPNFTQPLKEHGTSASVDDRLAMVRLALNNHASFRPSTVELDRDSVSYTIETMRALQNSMGSGTKLYFLAGRDILLDLHRWKEPEALLSEFNAIIMTRPMEEPIHWGEVEANLPDLRARVTIVDVASLSISSSDIRRRVRTGWSITHLVPATVEAYIYSHHLYQGE
jgi:nicotinate-nucleotide adenylyltransferase